MSNQHPLFGGASFPGTSHSLLSAQYQQRLKVEDALTYLERVKVQFGSQPHVYNDFLDIMKDFKSQSIDTPGVIQRVSKLFRGHPNLIIGFNTFLPPGYHIDILHESDGDRVRIRTPTGRIQVINNDVIETIEGQQIQDPSPAQARMASLTANATSSASFLGSTTNVGPLHGIRPFGQNVHGLQASLMVSVTGGHMAHLPQPSGSHGPAQNVGTQQQQSFVQGGGVVSDLPRLPAQPVAPTPAPQQQPPPQTKQPPVEFNHAISYVNKIKCRFQDLPDVYKQFLEILHRYQKQQKLIREEAFPADEQKISEREVYHQVAELFAGQEDLLDEFAQFLPETQLHHQQQQQLQKQQLQKSAGGGSSPSALQQNQRARIKTEIKLEVQTEVPECSANFDAISSSSTTGADRLDFDSSPSPVVVPPAPSPVAVPPLASLKRPAAPSSELPTAGASPKKSKTVGKVHYDVSYAEAAKYGKLSEYQFFDKVRRALKNDANYDNFLRCLVLFNKELVSRTELLSLVTQFLSKSPELLKWLKDFLKFSDFYDYVEPVPRPVVNRQQQQAGIQSELAYEIDFASCKQYGKSYRALPDWYLKHKKPVCSGRTVLCDEVLNDLWVSFPSWSSETSSGMSKKSVYEEHIYRTEDERFELDIVIEVNKACILALQHAEDQLRRLPADQKSTFKIEDCIGGRSKELREKAVKRIYGDKAGDVLEGLRRNPVLAIPLVLKRLKGKDEEWCEAQRRFNQIWREQNDKFYLKSLDHQANNFKQEDFRRMRPKALINTIEVLFDARNEKADVELPQGPHLTVQFALENREIFYDAIDLVIHHVRRREGMQPEEKYAVKKLLRQVFTDLFGVDRQELSDDEDDAANDDDDGSSVSSSSTQQSSRNNTRRQHLKRKDAASAQSPKIDRPRRNRLEVDRESKSQSDLVHCGYTFIMFPDAWFVFLSLQQMLCERLAKLKRQSCAILSDQEASRRAEASNSTTGSTYKPIAELLKLRAKSNFSDVDPYATLLDLVKNVLDGQVEQSQYEDTLRDIFTIHAYTAFTMDKLIQSIVRQLQAITSNDDCLECLKMYESWSKKFGGGGYAPLGTDRVKQEEAYQRASELLLSEKNCYKCFVYHDTGRVTFELLDTESYDGDCEDNDYDVVETVSTNHRRASKKNEKNQQSDQDTAVEVLASSLGGQKLGVAVERTWSDYVDKFVNDVTAEGIFATAAACAVVASEASEAEVVTVSTVTAKRKPFMLMRNIASGVKRKREIADEIENSAADGEVGIEEATPTDDAVTTTETSKPLKNVEKLSFDLPRGMFIVENEQVCFKKGSYKFSAVCSSGFTLARFAALRLAKKSHRMVTLRRHELFGRYLDKWVLANVSMDEARICNDWLMGLTAPNLVNSMGYRTTRLEIGPSDVKAPYRSHYRYVVQDSGNVNDGQEIDTTVK